MPQVLISWVGNLITIEKVDGNTEINVIQGVTQSGQELKFTGVEITREGE